MKRVPVGDTYALIDDQDYDTVMAFAPWHLGLGYAVHGYWEDGKSKAVRMHRLVLGLGTDDPHVDHVNHNRLDNRRSNLRLCTIRQNTRHSRPQRTYAGDKTSSHFKGVDFITARGKWHARIQTKERRISLGHFEDEVAAARAYDSAAAHFFGQFAVLNFPDETPATYAPPQKPTSPYPGVCYESKRTSVRKWRARFTRGGKTINLGHFLTEEQAIAACEKYKREH